MANGPATPLLQQALLTLLQGRKPDPMAPVPIAPADQIGPLDMETTAALAALQPQPVPPALPGPVDADAIRSRFSGLAGPEPVAPAIEPALLIIRVARMLQGFGAGVQGQGPKFLERLREEREAPQREFRARKERFETRRQELGVMAEQEVGRAEDRRQARTQELLDRQLQREFDQGVRRLNLRDQREQDLFRDALLAKRQREDDDRAATEQRRREDAQQKKDARAIASKFGGLTTPEIARELGDYYAGITDKLSPAASKFESAQAKLAEIRAARAAGGGAARPKEPKVLVEIQNPDGSTSVVPLTPQVSAGLGAGTITQGPRGVFMEGQRTQTQPTPAISTGFPELAGTPFGSSLLSNQQQPGHIGKVFTRAEVQDHAKRNKRDPKAVEADIRARGGIVQ